jgi:hypothetical protein
MRKYIIVIVFAFVAFVFYWIYVRPAFVRMQCLRQVEDAPGEWRSVYYAQKGNNDYRVCLVKNGIAPESILVNLQ